MPRLRNKLLWNLLCSGCAFVCLTAWGLSRAVAADATPAQVSESLIFLRAEHPVFVRMTVLIDGQELRSRRDERIRQTIAELDSNGDQVIDKSERDAHPKALRNWGLREKWADLLKLIDTAPQDDKISLAELTVFGVKSFGAPVRLVRRNGNIRRSSQAVELFDLLDEDQNQQLSKAEFSMIGKRLSKLDADGDDAFSVVEVEPFRNPFGPRTRTVATQPEDSPWLIAESAAEFVLKKFDHQSPMGSLSVAELGVPGSVFASGDSNHDGELSIEELRGWLPTAPPNYVLTVNLPQLKAGKPHLTWTDASATPPLARPRQRVRPAPELKSLKTVIASQALELEVSAAKSYQTDNLNYYRLQFRRADQDKNKYLSATEFAALNLPGATFEVADMDGNGEFHDNELKEFLNLEADSDRGHVMLAYDSNEISLFSILDGDRDNRLSPRECQKASASWQSFDKNQDGKLERHELTGNLRLAVELVKPDLFNNLNAMPANMTGEPMIGERTAGPAWFRGMDRNRDSDVSRREFVGTDESFKKWDKDGDGLISVKEAEGK